MICEDDSFNAYGDSIIIDDLTGTTTDENGFLRSFRSLGRPNTEVDFLETNIVEVGLPKKGKVFIDHLQFQDGSKYYLSN